MCSDNTNAFACTRPPGHHAGRYGCTGGCLSTGFCLLNNAAIAMVYSRCEEQCCLLCPCLTLLVSHNLYANACPHTDRVRWGLERVAVVDIDVHFGNGTAELLRGDPRAFFASVHMIYGDENSGSSDDRKPGTRSNEEASNGFYPSLLGTTEVTDTYVSVGVFPPHPPSKGERNYFGRNPSAASKELKEVKLERRSSEDSLVAGLESSGSNASLKEIQHSDGDASAVSDIQDSDAVGEPTTPSSKMHSGTQAGKEREPEKEREQVKAEANSDSIPGPKSSAQKEFRGVAGFRLALSDVIIPQVTHAE